MKPVFIHISKNAGSSIVETAGSAIVNAGHRTAIRWRETGPADATTFAVVRHPYERALSEYRYRRARLRGGEQNRHLLPAALGFSTWVAATYVDGFYQSRAFFELTAEPFDELYMVGDRLIWVISQAEWLCDENGDLLVDHVLRFENLEVEWKAFAEQYGLPSTIVHENPSPSDLRRKFDSFDQPTREILHHHFLSDFEMFGYEP